MAASETGVMAVCPGDRGHHHVATAPGRTSALQADAITKRYGGRLALDNVSVAIDRGTFVALLGASGAGKTTMINCLAGLIVPDHGQVRLDDRAVSSLTRLERRRIAVVFQQFNLVGRLSVMHNVLAGRLGDLPVWRGVLRRFRRHDVELARTCLERVGMAQFAARRADSLSGGQQQRVAIARALAQQPEVIVADEPVASVDPGTGSEMLALLRRLCNEEGALVVCSLHQPEFARRFADRIVGLTHGRVMVDCATSELDDALARRLYSATIAHSSSPVPGPNDLCGSSYDL